MNILMTTTTLPRWKDDSESNWVLELAKHLSHRVVILAPHAVGSERFERLDGVDIVRFRYAFKPCLCYGEGVLPNFKRSFRAKLQALVFPFAEFFSMRKVVKMKKIDLVIAWWVIPQGLVAALHKKLFGTGYVVVAAGSDIFSCNNYLFRLLQGFVFRNAKKVIVTSSALKKEVVKRFPNIKPVVIPVGVNDYFKPGLVRAEKTVLCVGRLTPQKGFDVAIRAVGLLKGFKLFIAGEGSDLSRLKDLAGELDVDVEFLGRVGNRELVRYYQRASVFVLPSIGFEALGMVCAEALACGTKVVASDLGGIKDIVVDGVTGRLFEPGNTVDLKDKILEVLKDDYCDVGIMHVRDNFSWGAIANKYEQVI